MGDNMSIRQIRKYKLFMSRYPKVVTVPIWVRITEYKETDLYSQCIVFWTR